MSVCYSKIMAVGSHLPQKIVSNHDLAQTLDTSDEWIRSRTGIGQRHIAAADETTLSMALAATKKALASAAIAATDIDMIIVATCTPEMSFPSTACLLQQSLDIVGIPAFDLTAACSGFIYALTVADQFIRSGAAKTILVVGSEMMSQTLDWQDRSSCVLFGDGAGAILLQASQKQGIIDSVLHADGRHSTILELPNARHHKPSQQQSAYPAYLSMKGREVYRLAVTELPNTVNELLQRNQMTVDNIDWLVPHQANARIIELVAKRLHFPLEKVIMTVEQHANTSAASIPLAFDVAVQDGRIKSGDVVLMEAIGGGLTWGGVLLRV